MSYQEHNIHSLLTKEGKGIELLPFLFNHEALDDVEHLKVKMVDTILKVYQHYPTLHAFHFLFDGESWKISIHQLAWDSVEKIKASEEYQNTHLNIHAFCWNAWNDDNKKQEKNIPTKEGELINKIELEERLQNIFSFLNDGLGMQLKECLASQEGNSLTYMPSRNYNGYLTGNLEEKITNFFGKKMLNKILHNDFEKLIIKKDNVEYSKPKL